ncbi:MAG: M1 family aminopeptidase, partial [Bacteroidota bacterium]
MALLDLFGQNSFMLATKDWDLATKNSDALPISNLVIYNRIFWMTFSSFVFYFFYKKFNFQYHPIWVGKNNNNTNTAEEKSAIPTTSKINFDFSFWGKTKAFFYLVRYDFTSIIKYWMFWIVVAFGILTIFFIQRKTVETGDFNLLPLTRLMLFAPLQIYTLVILVVTFLFAGILLGKAKRTKMDTLIDVTPIETAQLLGSKILALSFVQVLMLLLFLGCGVGIQWSNGYTHFELGLYCFQLFLVVLPSLLVWNITSVFVHVLFPNIFVGLFLLLMFWFGVDALPNFGVETYLLRFNQNIPLTYSDFQGFGDQLSGYFLITGYWLVVAVVIILATFLFWNRGSLNTLKERIKNARKRLNRSVWVGMLLAVGSFVFLGFKIYDAEQRGFSLYKVTAHLEKFKATWAIYGKAQQPKIKAIELNLDLFPEENRFVASGTYVLKNESERAMDTLLIRTGFDEKTSVKWSRAVSVLDVDTVMKYQAFILSTPLAVGDSLQLLFEIKSTDNNLFTRNSSVLFNGTFLQYDILPRLHYQFAESKNDKDYNYFSPEANLVQLKTTISTSKDQVAIAPGKLMQENTTEHRREFVYQTQQPIKFNFSFHAGQFLVRAEKYQGIQLETFCLPQHKHNVNEMLQGLKAAIDYNTNLFGKYPYEAIRVVEFPHTEASFSATLTANNIPTSEVMFNINMDAMEGKLNLPFYVMAHELTHEWFSNQVMPADVAGAKMLTESITEYLTLGIYRKSLGAEMAAQFLKIQHQRYHNGRKTERKVEMPLTKVASRQDYIAYGKGAVVFNTLAHRIGEDQMNEILKKYFAEFRGRTKAHPTPKDFIHLMKNEIDSTYYHLVEELFESVIFYNNKITGMNRISSTQVELKITAQKFYNNKSTNLDFK